MTLKHHMGPKKNWDDEKWLQHAQIMGHSLGITEEGWEYWKDKIKELL